MYRNNEGVQYSNDGADYNNSTVYQESPAACSSSQQPDSKPGLTDDESSSAESDHSSNVSESLVAPCSLCLQQHCICEGSSSAFNSSALSQMTLLTPHQTEICLSPSSSLSDPPPPFICQVCQEWFVIQEKLVLHLVMNHAMVYCKFCTRLFRSQSEHRVCSVNRGARTCQVCRHSFPSESVTSKDALTVHQSQVHDLHACLLCGFTFSPKCALLAHMKKKHHYHSNLPLENIISDIPQDTFNFLCSLCHKKHARSELFGHFHSYHHLTLPCLIELLNYGRVFIPIAGYHATFTASNDSHQANFTSQNNPSSNVNNSGITCNFSTNNQDNNSIVVEPINSCSMCRQAFSVQVPKVAHDVFCLQMTYCQHCALSFSSGLARELHVVREHSSLPCCACDESFPAETSLRAHHARAHSSVLCPCCDILVPPASLPEHLATRHNCVPPTPGCMELPSFNVGNQTFLCSLCLGGSVFTAALDDVVAIFTHLCDGHGISQGRALHLLGTTAIPKEEEELEEVSWNQQDQQQEDILVPQVDLNATSEGESSNEEEEEEGEEAPGASSGEEESEREGPAQADVDPSELECLTDSSDDEGTPNVPLAPLSCVYCSEITFKTPRELCAHMSSAHNFRWGNRTDSKINLADESKYFCERCSHAAEDRVSLWRHRALAHPGVEWGGVKCRLCPRRFPHAEARNYHGLNEHEDQHAWFRCHCCHLLFASTVVLGRHMASAHLEESLPQGAVRFKCRLCLLLFPHMDQARAHFNGAHPAAMIFRCRHCSACLKSRKTLKQHVKTMHAEVRRRECGTCGKVLWSKRAYAIHYRMKHSKNSKVGFRCRICQQRFDTKEQRKLHYTIDHEGESPYHCIDCGKGFASKSGMYGHRQLHTGSGISKCEYCGKEFTRKDSYNEHLLIHNGPRHKCPHCPKEFVQRSNLVRHIRIHTGEKPYQCTFCEKRFSDKGACNSHIRVHTREETCSCPYCGQTFSKKQKLKYHIRKHTGEGLIECEICNKMFTNSFALKEHRVIHNRQTQVVCPQCGKGFNSEKYLQRHVAIVHEPSNAFSCPLCPKTFSQQARLKAHLMTHSGVKHMKCLLCDKAYSVRKSLRRHLLEKHQVSPDHPQYKQCFHAMSPEEAGLGIDTTLRAKRTTPRSTAASSSSGRKRRRVEQIVQSLQHSLSAAQPSISNPAPESSLARIRPLVVNRARRRRPPSPRRRSRRLSAQEEEEGLNLSIPRPPEDSEGDSDRVEEEDQAGSSGS